MKLLSSLQRLGTIPGLTDNLDVGLGFEEGTQARPDDPLIIGQQDRNHDAEPFVGSRADTRNPPPGSAVAVISPASSRTLSRMPTTPYPGLLVGPPALPPVSMMSSVTPSGARLTSTDGVATTP